MKTASIFWLLIALSLPIVSFASENIWVTFGDNPSKDNFEQCSKQIKESIDGHYPNLRSPTYLTLMKPVAFAPLLRLIEEGDAYALRLGFELIPIALQNASVSEELFFSLGRSIKTQPELFLVLLQPLKDSSSEIASSIVVGSEEGMNEEWGLALREIDMRLNSIKVHNPNTKAIKQYSINILETGRKDILNLMHNQSLKFAPSGRWDAPSARPLASR